MTKPLVILGSVGNCLDIVEAVRAGDDTAAGQSFELVGFLDDAPESAGQPVAGLPVLGPLSLAREMSDTLFVCGIGSPRSFRAKESLIAGLGVSTDRFASVVHPSAVVSRSATIGHGSVILANSTICAGAGIGDHVMMLPNCVVGHDTQIGDFSIMAAGVTVSGAVRIAKSCYLGAGSSYRDGVAVGEGALVGMGSVVVRDVPAGCVVAGSPARKVRGRDE